LGEYGQRAGGPIAGVVDYEQSDRNPQDRSVAVHRWDIGGRPINLAVTSGHRRAEANPMPLAIFRRDDEVERPADRIFGPVPEQSLGPGIPDADYTGDLGENECGLHRRHVAIRAGPKDHTFKAPP
jgi:hypothetical protein